MRQIALYAALISISAGFPVSAIAQFGGGGTGNQSGFGGSGGTGGFGGTGGLGGIGSGGLGGTSGRGGAGGGLGGGLGGTTNGLGGAGGFGQTGTQGAMNGQQQGQNFLGRNTNTNQFLGRNIQGQGQGLQGNQNNGNRRAGGNGNRNNNNPNNQGNQMNGGQNGGGQASQLPPVRPRQMVGFTYSKPQLAAVSTKLEVRLRKMSSLTDVNMTVEPTGELVLRGQAASRHDAKLAEDMARMEPGVNVVRNEMTYPDPKPEPVD
ncbi:BON domain-containing protein [Schlesneria paludicola]|uniref:BON domain-containing protein n=1 Tax=Schlesneria paludicola TaxID=360056 RepID=UPI000299D39A|nr:BON domain-containing protein [Schlesneria paludicola]